MMQTIRFKGLNLAIDEQAVENGALAICDGMELYAGALRPCVIEGEAAPQKVHGEILYIHELSNGKKIAIYALQQRDIQSGQSVGDLYYVDITDEEAQPHTLDYNDPSLTRSVINSVSSNGNTLVMLTDNGLKYFRWKNGAYKYLGKMPELELRFSLNTGAHMMYDFVKDDYDTDRQKAIQYDSSTETEVDVPYTKKITYLGREFGYTLPTDVDYEKSDTLLAREEAMDAAVSKYHNACQKAKYFAYPFFIRYCYRLSDGRKVMHSAPVLMFSDYCPEIVLVGRGYRYKNGKDGDKEECHSHISILMPQQLHLDVVNTSVLNTIKNDWEDIITGIDVYITPDISRRDEDVQVTIPESGNYPWEGKWSQLEYEVAELDTDVAPLILDGLHQYEADFSDEALDYAAITLIDNDLAETRVKDKLKHVLTTQRYIYKDWEGMSALPIDPVIPAGYLATEKDFYALRVTNLENKQDWGEYAHTYGVFVPKMLSEKKWQERLENQNAYYLLHRFDIRRNELPESGLFPIDNNVLENIEAQEQMITSTAPDDYRTHNDILAKTAYVYNNRINIMGIQEIPFEGFPAYCMMPAVDHSSLSWRRSVASVYTDPVVNIVDVIVRLQDENGSVYVHKQHNIHNTSPYFLRNTFVFYPDTRAMEMWIYDNGQSLIAHFVLKEHPFLNGAYHMGSFGRKRIPDPEASEQFDFSLLDESPVFRLPNYIFTSASDNPFVFPAAHRYAVGLGEVRAIASTTRALSQGQFGQYPLMAFASDGIYALDVSSTGSYSDIQPISREVITNAKALLQLDQSIAFITRRAINQLMSSDVTELSAVLSGALRDLSAILGIQETHEVHDLIGAVQNADAIYDFVGSRLLYFLKDDSRAYTGDVLVFCATDTAWAFKSLGENAIRGVYNSYPYPYVHYTDGTLECLSVPYDNKEEGEYNGIVVTRAIKAEGVRNAIREFFQDYDFGADTDRPTLILWGSNDNRTWHYIGRSNARQMGRLPGRIYRYFRLAVQFKGMRRNDLYHGVQLDIQERFTR